MLDHIDHRKLLNDDRETLEAFLKGLDRLTMRIARGKYRFQQHEAEDILLEVLRKLWDADKAPLRLWRGDGSLSAYLSAIVHRFCLMEVRRRKRRATEQPTERLDDFPGSTEPPPIERDQLTALYRRAAAGLAPRDRRLLEMRFVEEQDYQAIVSELGISYAAARKAVHSALKRVRERMRDLAPELFPAGSSS